MSHIAILQTLKGNVDRQATQPTEFQHPPPLLAGLSPVSAR